MELERDSIERLLAKLDNPMNLGNQGATPQDVITDTENIGSISAQFVNIFAEGKPREHIIQTTKEMAYMIGQMFDDTKGASRKIDQTGIYPSHSIRLSSSRFHFSPHSLTLCFVWFCFHQMLARNYWMHRELLDKLYLAYWVLPNEW